MLGFLLPLENEEEWIPLTYEKLGDFCYRCRRITHTNRNCQDDQYTITLRGVKQ